MTTSSELVELDARLRVIEKLIDRLLESQATAILASKTAENALKEVHALRADIVAHMQMQQIPQGADTPPLMGPDGKPATDQQLSDHFNAMMGNTDLAL